MENLAHEILAPPLRDLESSGVSLPAVDVEHSPRSTEEIVMLLAPDGTGVGFRAGPWEDRALLIARATEKVQEWALEQSQDTGVSNWPPCPVHPGSHPLFVTVEEGAAVWSCTESGMVISEVGSLYR
ncbi:hypothetical protein [Arthrobacter sp.]|uniref:hypothetical protein n=1 Tax=Arthrobacter sp. TaxID=1667 RepID=UPI00258F6423|nr:hypothetical protein [Arthrobacter sp.]